MWETEVGRGHLTRLAGRPWPRDLDVTRFAELCHACLGGPELGVLWGAPALGFSGEAEQVGGAATLPRVSTFCMQGTPLCWRVDSWR